MQPKEIDLGGGFRGAPWCAPQGAPPLLLQHDLRLPEHPASRCIPGIFLQPPGVCLPFPSTTTL